MTSKETALWYIAASGGDLDGFRRDLDARHNGTGDIRFGQAFFNALTPEDQARIRGTIWDTFYSDEPFKAWEAVERLTR